MEHSLSHLPLTMPSVRFILFHVLFLFLTLVDAKSKSSKSKKSKSGKSLPIPAKYALSIVGGLVGLAGLIILGSALRTKFFPKKKETTDEEAPAEPQAVDEKSSSFGNPPAPEVSTPPAYEKEPAIQFPVPQLAPVLPMQTGGKS